MGAPFDGLPVADLVRLPSATRLEGPQRHDQHKKVFGNWSLACRSVNRRRVGPSDLAARHAISVIFVNWNDALLEVLSFGEGVGWAIFWISFCRSRSGRRRAPPAPGDRQPALARDLADRVDRIIESALDDISENFRLEWLFEALFEKKGGLSVQVPSFSLCCDRLGARAGRTGEREPRQWRLVEVSPMRSTPWGWCSSPSLRLAPDVPRSTYQHC